MIKFLVSDMDGTLFEGHGATVFDLSARNEEALQKIRQSDIQFCVASGRMIDYGVRVLEKYGFKPVIAAGFNGGVVTCDGTLIYQYPLPKATIRLIYDAAKESQEVEYFMVQTVDSKRNFSDPQHPIAEKYRRDAQKIQIGEVLEVTLDRFLAQKDDYAEAGKLSILLKTKEACQTMIEQLRHQFSEQCTISQSGDKLIEISSPEANKGTFVRYLMQSYQLQPNEIAVIGDALNDAEMFDACEVTFAMESGMDLLKAKANYRVRNVAECIELCLRLNQMEEEKNKL